MSLSSACKLCSKVDALFDYLKRYESAHGKVMPTCKSVILNLSSETSRVKHMFHVYIYVHIVATSQHFKILVILH